MGQSIGQSAENPRIVLRTVQGLRPQLSDCPVDGLNGLVPFNVASKAALPKVQKHEVNYFQPEQVAAIRGALEQEPIKWKTLTHMLLITGARRGEVLGLKWDKVDFNGHKIHICNNVLYAPDRGIYEDTPKTATSDRFITLPLETMDLLRKYRAWQSGERLRLGEYYQNQGFVFAQDNGKPMHPDSVTDWLSEFSKTVAIVVLGVQAFAGGTAGGVLLVRLSTCSPKTRLICLLVPQGSPPYSWPHGSHRWWGRRRTRETSC